MRALHHSGTEPDISGVDWFGKTGNILSFFAKQPSDVNSNLAAF